MSKDTFNVGITLESCAVFEWFVLQSTQTWSISSSVVVCEIRGPFTFWLTQYNIRESWVLPLYFQSLFGWLGAIPSGHWWRCLSILWFGALLPTVCSAPATSVHGLEILKGNERILPVLREFLGHLDVLSPYWRKRVYLRKSTQVMSTSLSFYQTKRFVYRLCAHGIRDSRAIL